MIRHVGRTRPWGPSRKRVPKCLKGPKTTYTTFAFAKKHSRSKRAHFVIYWVPPGPTQEMKSMGPGGEGPSRSPPPPPVSPAMISCKRLQLDCTALLAFGLNPRSARWKKC